ncbi:MAG: hypothetical protein WEA04_03000 [Candidatus Andersenbacteria bacterium]
MAHTKTLQFNVSAWLYGGMVAVLLLGLIFAARQSSAADRYTFLMRGDVMKLDAANKNIHVYIRHVNSAAEHDAGQTIEIDVRSATFYNYDSKQRKVRTTLGSLAVGDEVVIRGTGGSGIYNADWVVENDNLVKVLGTVDTQDVSNNFLKVEIESVTFQSTGKAYKANIFKKGAVVRVYYDEDSVKFISRDGNAMRADEIANNGEKITLKNIKVKYGSRFEADAAAPVSEITDGKHL